MRYTTGPRTGAIVITRWFLRGRRENVADHNRTTDRVRTIHSTRVHIDSPSAFTIPSLEIEAGLMFAGAGT